MSVTKTPTNNNRQKKFTTLTRKKKCYKKKLKAPKTAIETTKNLRNTQTYIRRQLGKMYLKQSAAFQLANGSSLVG